jgi:hypothetical protein
MIVAVVICGACSPGTGCRRGQHVAAERYRHLGDRDRRREQVPVARADDDVPKVYLEFSRVPPRSPDVNMILTVSLLASVVSYSSEVQQPMHATAVLGCHPRTHHAAPFDHDQGRAGSLHPDGLIRAACPLRARRHGLRRSVAVIHGQGQQPLTCKYSGQQSMTSQFPS